MKFLQRISFNIFLTFFILSTTVIWTIIGSFGIFKWDARYLQLDLIVHLSQSRIWHNYLQVMDYLLIPNHSSLKMTDFYSSCNGLQHFHDVKILFLFVIVIWVICLLIFVSLLMYKKFTILLQINNNWLLFLTVIPIVLAACSLIDFDSLFAIFHRILFHNSNWLFDPLKDPVINILPDTFFCHCFILAFVIFELLVIVLLYVNHKKSRQF
ncbi:TIGR01906 family membrane protein [Bombilactobacillus thymidiniphilus]|uniref:TIGR01906 family membrane protein n=2 Tax=Bombilactobacillus thymidiniphilus TaxID=2923363 RepID=A0ABY4PDY7_9LACO|nr:TIGR01906 family membrane protein [Bombilactobacillus thymidiniphilus]UQS83873.1 TIGR01906 family membrane protein [Bombilactobacillus thymidiniphilus]